MASDLLQVMPGLKLRSLALSFNAARQGQRLVGAAAMGRRPSFQNQRPRRAGIVWSLFMDVFLHLDHEHMVGAQ